MRKRLSVLVSKIVNGVDPIYLLRNGAPEDEYSDEINNIVSIFNPNMDKKDLIMHIQQIFVESFGEHTAADISTYEKIAEKILEEYKRDFGDKK